MQIKLIKKNTSTGRVEFYDPTNVFLGSVPATSPMRVGKNTVNFNGVGDDIFSIGYNADFTTTQIDAGSVTPAPNTFALFLTLLQTSFFNATNAGGSGGGGVGEPTDLKAIDPNDNASLVSLSKGQLENLALMQEVLGYGGSPIVIDPVLGGTIPGILKGILYNVAPPVPTNSYFLNTGALTVGRDFRSLLNASQSRKITGGVFSARASAGDKMLILFDYQPGGTAPTATDIRAVYVLPSGNHSIQIAPMNFESGIWVLVAQSSNTDNPASLTALSANHASVSIFHEPTTLV